MIALLGATGYVGRSLARAFARHERRRMVLFTRDPSRFGGEAWPEHVSFEPLTAFHADRFDLIINSIGAGDPARVKEMGADILDVTDLWDRRVLDTMQREARYVFLSSGAIYGTGFTAPANADSELRIPVNDLGRLPPYVLSKLIAEFRHRQMPERHILDLRLFAHADPSIPEHAEFFLAELARSVRHRTSFTTHREDFIRDYTGAEEMRALISAWEAADAPHGPADVYSLAPVSKSALLEAASRRFNLEINWDGEINASPTGTKSVYASQFKAGAKFGYAPWRSALDVALETLDAVARID